MLAGNLAVGTSILTRAGPPVVVQRVETREDKAGIAVYNFIVQDDHTYFVGSVQGGEWVHNAYGAINAGDDLGKIMEGSAYKPTQGDPLSAQQINDVAEQMRDGSIDWSNRDPILVKPNSPLEVLDGHHTVVAAHITGYPIPDEAIKTLGIFNPPVRSWGGISVAP